MSVSFYVSNEDGRPVDPCTCDDANAYRCEQHLSLNLANMRAVDLLQWLGIGAAEYLIGSAPASDLVARCRRRLWPEARNLDPEVPDEQIAPRAVVLGHGEGYLRQRTEILLGIAERATTVGGWVSWA